MISTSESMEQVEDMLRLSWCCVEVVGLGITLRSNCYVKWRLHVFTAVAVYIYTFNTSSLVESKR